MSPPSVIEHPPHPEALSPQDPTRPQPFSHEGNRKPGWWHRPWLRKSNSPQAPVKGRGCHWQGAGHPTFPHIFSTDVTTGHKVFVYSEALSSCAQSFP